MKLQGFGTVVAEKAPNFELPDNLGGTFQLEDALLHSNVMLVFYPNDFTMICTEQLCNYRDHIEHFMKYDLRIYGISPNSRESHVDFAIKYDFPFLLLSDLGKEVTRLFKCQSTWMFGNTSRAVFIINKKGVILYKYVEPTIVTYRKASEIRVVLDNLRQVGMI